MTTSRPKKPLRYLSFFSGIGGFELAIHSSRLKHLGVQPVCLGFSEIKPHALRVYERHFPAHRNLGDITQLTRKTVRECIASAGGCDLVVAGFPCTNLSSQSRINHKNTGLQGEQSSLLFVLLKVLKWILQCTPRAGRTHIVLENVQSMRPKHLIDIQNALQHQLPKVSMHETVINSNQVGCVQRRVRRFWTTFPVTKLYRTVHQDLTTVLESDLQKVLTLRMSDTYINNTMNNPGGIIGQAPTQIANMAVKRTKYMYELVTVKNKATRWRWASDTSNGYMRNVATGDMSSNMMLIDRRFHPKRVLLRWLSECEVARLSCLPKGYLAGRSRKEVFDVCGNIVLPPVALCVLLNLLRGDHQSGRL
jgi:site-specific DNA-cytosine methylase